MATRKVKVILASAYIDDYDDLYSHTVLYPAAGDWEEIDDKDYTKLAQAVAYANSRNPKGRYVLIEYSEDTMEVMFKSASDFIKKMEKDEADRKRKAEEAKRKREEKAMERKRKQLEKLKKELGE